MIIWSGHGYLVFLIFLFFEILKTYAMHFLYNCSYIYTHTFGINLFIDILIIISLTIIYLYLGKFLNTNKRYFKKYINPETGEPVVLKKSHSFFFIPVYIWAYITPILGIIFLINVYIF